MLINGMCIVLQPDSLPADLSTAEEDALWKGMMTQFEEHAQMTIAFAKSIPGILF